MKKVLAFILSIAMLFSLCLLTACGKDTQNVESNVEEPTGADLIAIYGTQRVNDYLMEVLVAPNSLTYNSIRCVVDENNYYVFEFDYGAENRLGGTVRETIYIMVSIGNDNSYGVVSVGSPNFYDSQPQSYAKKSYMALEENGFINFDVDYILGYVS